MATKACSSSRGLLARLQEAIHSRGDSGGSSRQPEAWARPQVDKKLVDKCLSCVAKVDRLSRQPQLNLRNSPPYLPDIVQEIFDHLRGIVGAYNENYSALSDIEYFCVFLHSLLVRCKQVCQLFKDGKDKMYDESSNYRQQLTKVSLTFSHMLKDLQALFPPSSKVFSPGQFRVTKAAADEFWRRRFGGRAIVAWPEFSAAFADVHPVRDRFELAALRSTIDLTSNEHVSIFEFDVFVRLFQPWENVLQNWKSLAVTHPGYMAFLTYDEVRARLLGCAHRPGSYIYRQSCTKLGQWAIGYVTDDGQILQTIIQNKSLAQALVDGARDMFYLYPDGLPANPDISSLLHGRAPELIQVTQQQYEMYCSSRAPCQACKICMERDKELRLEPCGHYMCSSCLASIAQIAEQLECPFCRQEVKGTEPVVWEPFLPAASTTTTTMTTTTTTMTTTTTPAAGPQSPKPPPRPPRTTGPADAAAAVQRPDEATTTTTTTEASAAAADQSSHTYASLLFDDASSSSAGSGSLAASASPSRCSSPQQQQQSESLASLVAEGFSEAEARQALADTCGDVAIARNVLLHFTLRHSPYVNIAGHNGPA